MIEDEQSPILDIFDSDDGIVAHRRLPAPDNRLVLLIRRLSFGNTQRASITIGEKAPLHMVGIIADTWDYEDLRVAGVAYNQWNPLTDPAPSWWNRWPAKGLYRINGHKDFEYLKIDSSHLDKEIERAIQIICGDDRVVQKITDESELLGASFPAWALCYRVVSTSSECEHTPKCVWYDMAFVSLDRCVIWQMKHTVPLHKSIGSIVLALTGELTVESQPGPFWPLEFLPLEYEQRRVDETLIRFRGVEVRVSTVFLPGSKISYSLRSRPEILLETMTFSTSKRRLDGLQARYYTREQAVIGHRTVVDFIREQLKKSQPNKRRIKAAQRKAHTHATRQT